MKPFLKFSLVTFMIKKILTFQGLKSIFKFSLVILDMSWHPTLWFQDDGICWNGRLPSTSVFLGVQCVSSFIWRIPCNCMQFCSRFSAGTDSDLTFFSCKTSSKQEITPKLVLNVIFVQFQLKTSSKKLKTPNKTDIVLVSDGFCRFFLKRVLNLWVPRFLVSNVHRSFGLQRDTFLGLKVEFSGDSGSYFFGRS